MLKDEIVKKKIRKEKKTTRVNMSNPQPWT
jgi:hypothetical protein